MENNNLNTQPTETVIEIKPRRPIWRIVRWSLAIILVLSISLLNKNITLGQIVGSVSSFSQAALFTAREALSSMFGGSNEEVVQTIDINSNIGYASIATSLLSDNTTEENISGQSTETSKAVITNKTKTTTVKSDEAETIADNKQDKVTKLPGESKKTEPPVVVSKSCSFITSQSPSHSGVILNEVAWMGGSSDFGLTSTDEWIELKNISNTEVNLNGWQILDKAEQIKIVFDGLVKIPANGFYLLERTDDNPVPNIAANLIYANTLNNADEGLRLFNNQCDLIDEVLASSDWPAGDNVEKRTMERSLDLSWHTYNGTVQNNIFGTPKKENSMPAVVVSSNANSGGTPANNQQTTNPSTSLGASTPTTPVSSPSKILISEVQITGGTGKTENDFIELYNPNNFQVNLNGYRLVKRTKVGTSDTSVKSWTTDVYIPASGYYLWTNSGYTDFSAIADIVTTTTISNDNGVAIRYGAEDTGTVIDSVAWGGAENIFIEGSVFPTNPGANQSFQRKSFIDTNNNANDFEIQTCPNPKTQSRICEQANLTPSVLLPLSIIEVIYNPDGLDEGRELVRLNNPNAEEIDISGYSLQYLGTSGDFLDIKKKNFAADNKILTQGIFKIGLNCSSNITCENVDMSWSQALNNTSGSVFLVSNQEPLTDFSDPDIIDGFDYPQVT